MRPLVNTAEKTNREPYLKPEIRDIDPVSYGVALHGQSDDTENYAPPDANDPVL
jgi:hypothetical protein